MLPRKKVAKCFKDRRSIVAANEPSRRLAMYHAAVIGCGKIGSEFALDPLLKDDIFTHAGAYSRSPETKLVAVCDSDSARVQRAGSFWGVTARYTDVKQLMEMERPDIVSVCTPEQSHFEVLIQMLSGSVAPRAILCEKPLVSSLKQAREVTELAQKRKTLLAVAYMRRFAENMRSVKTFIAEGRLGTVQSVNGWYTKGTLHNGSHWFDLLRFLVGEVAWVLGENAIGERGADPSLDILMGLKAGGTASLRALNSQRFTVFEMDIMGTLGRLQLLDSCFRVELSMASASPRYTGYVELIPVPADFGHRKNLMLGAVQDIVTCLNTGKPPACSGEDGIAALRIGWAALESAESGRRVYLG